MAGGPGKILIVDSNEKSRAYFEGNISLWGYSVLSATGKSDATDLIEKEKPDLIFIGLYLQDQPGLELLKQIKENEQFETVPVYMVHEKIEEEIRIVAISSGAEDLLEANMEPVDLSMRVQNALEIYKYRKKINELNQKLEREKSILLRYFSSDLVDQILKEEIRPELGGQLIEASVMFFDIRKSTTIAESLGAQNYSRFISALFTDLMDLIFAQRGSVNEILGDGILATFGCPVSDYDHRAHAVNAALSIRKKMAIYNEKERPDYLDGREIGYGIGISSGRIFAGNIGSSNHMKFAVMGPSVNRAARIQDLTKEVKSDLLFDTEVLSGITGRTTVQSQGRFDLRGVPVPVELFSIPDQVTTLLTAG